MAQSRRIGRWIVVAQDTTEINFAGREASRRGLGPAGDGGSAGFFLSPSAAGGIAALSSANNGRGGARGDFAGAYTNGAAWMQLRE